MTISNIGILPSGKCSHSRAQDLRLKNKSDVLDIIFATGIASLFLPYETKSEPKEDRILEVQAVAPVNSRSWFLDQEEDGSLGSFRPADDIFEEAAAQLSKNPPDNKDPSTLSPIRDILHFHTLPCVRKALRRLCDVKDITPEIVVYRFSIPKLEEYLRLKVARLGDQDVTESARTLVRKLAVDGLMEDGKEDLLKTHPHNDSSDSRCSFSKLDAYLRTVQDESALATMNTSSSKGKKTKGDDQKEDKKRKVTAKASQGVDKLKKANINGMAKMSSFFKKAG
ncbi:hypothetical protein HWV62_8995 [Athelia sp. TMB]|nr:hypothetical protein HWV62_8995 [Athelia sp. TMB]